MEHCVNRVRFFHEQPRPLPFYISSNCTTCSLPHSFVAGKFARLREKFKIFVITQCKNTQSTTFDTRNNFWSKFFFDLKKILRDVRNRCRSLVKKKSAFSLVITQLPRVGAHRTWKIVNRYFSIGLTELPQIRSWLMIRTDKLIYCGNIHLLINAVFI